MVIGFVIFTVVVAVAVIINETIGSGSDDQKLVGRTEHISNVIMGIYTGVTIVLILWYLFWPRVG